MIDMIPTYYFVFAGIICGIFLVLWLKERPVWRCEYCRGKITFQQQCCSYCGRHLKWNSFQRKPFMFTRYQTDEQFRKWDMYVPNVERKED